MQHFTRGTLTVIVALGLGAAATASTLTYSDPTKVNLLERWNTSGTYGLSVTTTFPNATTVPRAVEYHTAGYCTRVQTSNDGLTKSVRYTLDQPMVLGKVSLQFRGGLEAPMQYEFWDQVGLLSSFNASPAYLGSTLYTDTLSTGRLSTWVELRLPTCTSGNGSAELDYLGVFPAAGQAIPFDGTRSVFAEQRPTPVNFDSTLWTNQVGDRLNPNGPSWTAWHFSQQYRFTGAYLTHEVDSFGLVNAKIEVSADSTNGTDGTWTTAYATGVGSWVSAYGGSVTNGTGYMVFARQPEGTWARLSWDASGSGGGREINEFQLFAFVPEPASLSLLCLGALAVVRRRHPRH